MSSPSDVELPVGSVGGRDETMTVTSARYSWGTRYTAAIAATTPSSRPATIARHRSRVISMYSRGVTGHPEVGRSRRSQHRTVLGPIPSAHYYHHHPPPLGSQPGGCPAAARHR